MNRCNMSMSQGQDMKAELASGFRLQPSSINPKNSTCHNMICLPQSSLNTFKRNLCFKTSESRTLIIVGSNFHFLSDTLTSPFSASLPVPINCHSQLSYSGETKLCKTVNIPWRSISDQVTVPVTSIQHCGG